MKGIVLVSHGKLAEGMISSAEMLLGGGIKNLEWVSLAINDTPESFIRQVREKAEKVDDGDGIIILADLLGGTPCNLCAAFADKQVRLLTGMNLNMLIEVLLSREQQNLDWQALIDTARKGIVDYNGVLD